MCVSFRIIYYYELYFHSFVTVTGYRYFDPVFTFLYKLTYTAVFKPCSLGHPAVGWIQEKF
jgi:hypothetical protein